MTPTAALFSGLSLLVLAACSGASSTGGTPTPQGGAAGVAGAAGTLGGSASGAPSAGAAGQPALPTGGTAGDANIAGGAGTAGSGGTAGSDAANAGGAPDDTPVDLPKSEDFTCSWVLGITTTGEWYEAGFEKVVDGKRWQITPIEMGHLEKWADPAHEIWQSPIQSACATNSKTPDRVVFNATKYEWTTVEEFLPAYVAVVNNIKTKYPSVKRIDLITYGRAPGNMECAGANRPSYSYIKAAQDDAAAMIPAMFPGLVFVAPKWEHKACSDFGLCPHVSAAANATLATTIGQYFLKN